MKTCARCLLDERYPGLRFDDRGVCDQCRLFDRLWSRQLSTPEGFSESRRRLGKILDLHRGGRNGVDCVLAASGGLDSLYLLHYLKAERGMNPLVVSVDTGLLTEKSKSDLQTLCTRLGVRLIMHDARLPRPLFRASLLETGSLCPVCVFNILFHVTRIARENGVRLILFGMSRREDAFLPRGTSPWQVMGLMRRHRSLYPPALRVALRAPWLMAYYQFVGKIVTVPDYLPWDAQRNRAVIENLYGIHPGGEHADCRLHDLAQRAAYLKYGFSQQTLKLSQMIRNGKISRDEASASLREGEVPGNWAELLDFLSLDEPQLERALSDSARRENSFSDRLAQRLRRWYFSRGA